MKPRQLEADERAFVQRAQIEGIVENFHLFSREQQKDFLCDPQNEAVRMEVNRHADMYGSSLRGFIRETMHDMSVELQA